MTACTGTNVVGRYPMENVRDTDREESMQLKGITAEEAGGVIVTRESAKRKSELNTRPVRRSDGELEDRTTFNTGARRRATASHKDRVED